jgi:hypothetical protein
LLDQNKEGPNDTLYSALDRRRRQLALPGRVIDLSGGERGDILSGTVSVVSISFRETRAALSNGMMRRPANSSSH